MSKELLKQALDALMRMDKQSPYPVEPGLINAIRAALAVPEAKPVAVITECNVNGQQTVTEIEGRWKFLRYGDFLYTRPPALPAPVMRDITQEVIQRDIGYREGFERGRNATPAVLKPLTEDHVAELWVDILSDTPASGIHETEGLQWMRLARAVERAHGIKGECASAVRYSSESDGFGGSSRSSDGKWHG